MNGGLAGAHAGWSALGVGSVGVRDQGPGGRMAECVSLGGTRWREMVDAQSVQRRTGQERMSRMVCVCVIVCVK